jgi:adenosylcobinamide-phosphate synthase
VRWLGRLIAFLEPPLRRFFPERLGGLVLLLLVAGTAAGVSWGLLELAGLLHPAARLLVATVLVYQGLAVRSLARETQAVVTPCREEDWSEARRRLSRIVGRDTQDLPPEEIYRACVETVAENTTDGIVAPLLYAALFGPAGLWVFKAISTLDSMVGYRNARYRYFGTASARADDLVNLLPARLTWLFLALAGFLTGRHGWQALRIGWRDGRKHPSPNSAWGEATMAGALGIQLGGASSYQGVRSEKPHLGEPTQPLTPETVQNAIHLMLVTSWLTLAIAALPLAWFIGGVPYLFPASEKSGDGLAIAGGVLPALPILYDAVRPNTEGVEDRRLQVWRGHGRVGDEGPAFVTGAVGPAAANPTAGDQHRVGVRPVVAPRLVGRRVHHHLPDLRRPPELAHHQHQCALQQPPAVQVVE